MQCNAMQCNAMQCNVMYVCMYVCMYVYIYIYMGSFIPFTTFKKFCHSWLLTDVVKAEDLTATPWVKRRSLMWAWIRTHGMAQPLLGANAAHGGGGGGPSWALKVKLVCNGHAYLHTDVHWRGCAEKWGMPPNGQFWGENNDQASTSGGTVFSDKPIWERGHREREAQREREGTQREREREREGVGVGVGGEGEGEGALHKTEGRAMLVGFVEALPGQSIVSKCCEWHQPPAEGLLQGPRQIECDPLRESPSLLGDA